jgi:hypothetical protein
MKISKYIIGVLAFSGVITSCDTDNIGATYTPYAQNVSFEAAKAIDTKISDTSSEFTVRLIRNITNGEYTAHYTASSETEGIFTDANNGTVTFADGQGVAYINIKAANMERGNTYTYELKLSDADVATADTIIGKPITATKINVSCDYTWVTLGKGFYSSPDWWEDEYDVVIEKAEGTNVYKVKDMLADGYDILFTIGSDNVVTVLPQASWFYSGYGDVTLEGAGEGYVAGTYDPATKTIELTLTHILPAAGNYNFGTFTDTLTLP